MRVIQQWGAPLRTVVLVAATMGVSISASVLIARASPGQATAPALAFVGTLRKDGQAMASPQRLTFRFRKGGEEVCAPEADSGPIDPASGSFHALIPLDACPSDLLDGSDVRFDVEVNGGVVASDAPVAAVPYAKYAEQVGYADCPVGYVKAQGTDFVVCKKGPPGREDEIVKVGQGASAFWIDRYEAVLMDNRTDEPVADPSMLPEFPRTGRWLGMKPPARAESRRGVAPTGNITWFQANEACRASGKRLPTGDEWLTAARGTPDPGASDGRPSGQCNTSSGGPRMTGIDVFQINVSCASGWGAEDMLGNLYEWTGEWYAGIGQSHGAESPWPNDAIPGDSNGYANDMTWNIDSSAFADISHTPRVGSPTAALRGGTWVEGERCGVFTLNLDWSPAAAITEFGFRCVLGR